jgi:hypothetical protein
MQLITRALPWHCESVHPILLVCLIPESCYRPHALLQPSRLWGSDRHFSVLIYKPKDQPFSTCLPNYSSHSILFVILSYQKGKQLSRQAPHNQKVLCTATYVDHWPRPLSLLNHRHAWKLICILSPVIQIKFGFRCTFRSFLTKKNSSGKVLVRSIIVLMFQLCKFILLKQNNQYNKMMPKERYVGSSLIFPFKESSGVSYNSASGKDE